MDGTGGRCGLASFPRRNYCPRNQLIQAFHRIDTIALLGAKTPGFDDNDARSSCTISRQPKQPFFNIRIEGSGTEDVKTELDRCRHFIDVLATGTRGSDKFYFDFFRLDSEIRSVFIHHRYPISIRRIIRPNLYCICHSGFPTTGMCGAWCFRPIYPNRLQSLLPVK